MNTSITKYLLGACSLFMLTGCLNDYKELNTDPELLGMTDPRNVFTGATENFNNSSRMHLMGKYRGVMQLMQYVVSNDGAQEAIYVNTAKEQRPDVYLPYYSDYFKTIGLRLRYLVNTVIPQSGEAEKYSDLAAIANILETYEAWQMFDAYGAAPYTEAFRLAGENIRKPKYELYQKGLDGNPLYKVFDAKIKAAVDQLRASTAKQYNLGSNDYFYGGDVSKWIRFANTLRIKMAQRLEKADNAHYKAVVTDALASAGGIISANDQSCVYNHPNEYNNNTDDTNILTSQFSAGRAFVNFLTQHEDPRLPLLVRRNGFGNGNNNAENDKLFQTLVKYFPNYETKFAQWAGRYVGMSANPDSTASLWSNSPRFTINYTDEQGTARTLVVRHNSQVESRFYVKNGGVVGTQVTAADKEDATYHVSDNEISLFTPLITYPETCFMMAEIALKEGAAMGGKTAEVWFKEGIRASLEQYQAWATKMKVPAAMNQKSDNYAPITSAKIDAYLARPEFQSVTLEKIVTQQWINLFMRPEEAWATWKRTGLPAFKPQPTAENGVAYLEQLTTGGTALLIPRRATLSAPNSENIKNYTDAIEALKGDPAYGTDVKNSEGRIWWDKP